MAEMGAWSNRLVHQLQMAAFVASSRLYQVPWIDLAERIARVPYAGPSWTNDSAGFFYNQLLGDRGAVDRDKNSRAMFHRLRTDPATDQLILQNPDR